MKNCDNASIPDALPLIDDGGLYYDGSNIHPHIAEGVAASNNIMKLDVNGNPNNTRDGKAIFLTCGMSNFKKQIGALLQLLRETHGSRYYMTYVNGAQGSYDLNMLITQAYWNHLTNLFAKRGLSFNQVQVVWFEDSIKGQNKAYPADVREFTDKLEVFYQQAVNKFPNLLQFFCTSGEYSGYASGSAPRHEPWCYREGEAIKMFVDDHIHDIKPWVAWGPYIWANGIVPRSDFLVWNCDDFVDKDGVHQSTSGVNKAAAVMFKFFANNPATTWFRR